jgi:hypothetical protein
MVLRAAGRNIERRQYRIGPDVQLNFADIRGPIDIRQNSIRAISGAERAKR